MKAELLIKEHLIINDHSFVELVLWNVPKPVPGSQHTFKYRLAFVVNEICVVRYDNESGKGDHKHIGTTEIECLFESPEVLLNNFWHDVNQWREQYE